MYPDNILLWPDGFWCFREELHPGFLRDDQFRVVAHFTDEWLALKTKGPLPSKKAAD